jgi:hypothetical protein
MNIQPNNSGQNAAPEQQQTNQQTEKLTTKQIPQTMRDHQELMIKGIDHLITTELKILGRTLDDNQEYPNTVNREYNSSPQTQETDKTTNEYQATENQETTQRSRVNKSIARPMIQQVLPQYDTTPPRRNEAWGSSINNLPPSIFRIYFQNINGVKPVKMETPPTIYERQGDLNKRLCRNKYKLAIQKH